MLEKTIEIVQKTEQEAAARIAEAESAGAAKIAQVRSDAERELKAKVAAARKRADEQLAQEESKGLELEERSLGEAGKLVDALRTGAKTREASAVQMLIAQIVGEEQGG